jgi:hypothetical protein
VLLTFLLLCASVTVAGAEGEAMGCVKAMMPRRASTACCIAGESHSTGLQDAIDGKAVS